MLQAGGVPLLLSLPVVCYGPNVPSLQPLLTSIVKHMLEDPATLEGWMEGEIRAFFANRSRHYERYSRAALFAGSGAATMSSLLGGLSRVRACAAWIAGYMIRLLSICCLDVGR